MGWFDFSDSGVGTSKKNAFISGFDTNQIEVSQQYSNQFSTQTTTTDARVFAPSYQFQLNSPNASQKKTDRISSSPDVTPSFNPSLGQSAEQGQSGKSNILETALIVGGVAILGVVILNMSGKKK